MGKKAYWDSPEKSFEDIMKMISGGSSNIDNTEDEKEEINVEVKDMDGNIISSNNSKNVISYNDNNKHKEKENTPKSNNFKDIATGKAKVDKKNKDNKSSSKPILKQSIKSINFIINKVLDILTITDGITSVSSDIGLYKDEECDFASNIDADTAGDLITKLVDCIIMTKLPSAIYTASEFAGRFKSVKDYDHNKYMILRTTDISDDSNEEVAYVLIYRLAGHDTISKLMDYLNELSEGYEFITLNILKYVLLENLKNSASLLYTLNLADFDFNYDLSTLQNECDDADAFMNTFLNDEGTITENFDGFYVVEDHVDDFFTTWISSFNDINDILCNDDYKDEVRDLFDKLIDNNSIENNFEKEDDYEEIPDEVDEEEDDSNDIIGVNNTSKEDDVDVDELRSFVEEVQEEVSENGVDIEEEISEEDINDATEEDLQEIDFDDFEEVDADEIEEIEEVEAPADDDIIPVIHKKGNK
jgi:hypothetical protein